MENIQLWVQIIVTGLLAYFTYVTSKFQKQRITTLEDSFKDLQGNVDLYKKLVDIDEFKKHMDLKLENAKMEARQSTTVEMIEKMKETQSMVENWQITNATKSFHEALAFILWIRNQNVPNKENKEGRQQFIKTVFPNTHGWILQLLTNEDEVEAEIQKNQK